MADFPPGGAGFESGTRRVGTPAELPASVVNAIRPESYGNATGSDGTSAVQSAINAASTLAQTASAGIVDVLLTSGATYNLGQLSAAPGVRINAYGAFVNPILAEISQALFHWGTASSLNRFAILGGVWLGTGSEGSGANTQFLFDVGSNGGCNDVLFRDMFISNWGIGPLLMRNPLRAKALYNTILTNGAASAGLWNAINFYVNPGVSQGQDLMAVGNIVPNSQAAAIAYVNQNNNGPTDVRFIAAENICSGVAGGNNISGAIDVEFDGSSVGTWSRFLINNNHILNPATNGNAPTYGIVFGQSSNNATITQSGASGNTVIVNGSTASVGVETFGNADVSVTNNPRISAVTPIHGSGFKSGNKYSTGAAQGRATLVAGSVAISTTECLANDNVILAHDATGTNPGFLYVTGLTAGGFTINSSNAADVGTVYWRIDH